MSPPPITDGGGCQSSADWLIPRVAVDNFKELRLRFGRLAREWNVASPLTAHVEARSCSSLFTSKEIEVVQGCLVEFLYGNGFACNGDASPHQPFLLDAWGALAQLTDDIDAVLPAILSQGVPTGILLPLSHLVLGACARAGRGPKGPACTSRTLGKRSSRP